MCGGCRKPSAGRSAMPKNILAVDLDRSLRRPDEAAEDVEQRGLAGAVRTDQPGDRRVELRGEIVDARSRRRIPRPDPRSRSRLSSPDIARRVASDQPGQIDDLAGDALRRGDQGMQQPGAEHHGRHIAVDANRSAAPATARNNRPAKIGPDQWTAPPITVSANNMIDLLAGKAPCPAGRCGRQQRAGYAGEETGEGEGPDLVARRY